MKTLLSVSFCAVFLLSCSQSEKAKPNSVGEAPVVNQAEPITLQKQDPVATTISQQEVSRIALVEAEQFITDAKVKGIDYSAVMQTLEDAKLAYANNEFKQAQKLAVSVRQQVENLINKK